jgi:hypothetical protein
VLTLPLPMACPELYNKFPFSTFTMLCLFIWYLGVSGLWNPRSLSLGSKTLVSMWSLTGRMEEPQTERAIFVLRLF